MKKQRGRISPVKHWREEFCNQTLVVRGQLFDVDALVTFAIEVVRVEGLHSGKNFFVLLVGKVAVCALAVPRVEAVIPNHGESFGREGALILHDIVEVLKEEINN